ncbi:MAG: LAGLIDADG family homing endonuclease [Hadesarchaea archaeon]|nr:LAGLIDADG family homing endonuclease [Hadesarchaea archaeon]
MYDSKNELENAYWSEGKSINEIAHLTGVTYRTIYRRMVKFGIKRRTKSEGLRIKYKTQPSKLDLSPAPNLAYILGVLYGDGTVFKYYHKGDSHYRFGISLQVTQKKFALSFKQALEQFGFKPRFSFYLPLGRYTVEQYSKEFYHWFKALSPDDLRDFLSDNFCAREFIRGFYESEGCLSTERYIQRCRYKNKIYEYPRTGCSLSMTNTNLVVLTLVKNCLEKLELSFNMSSRQPPGRKILYRIYTAKRKTITRFLDLITPCIKNE